MNRELSFLRRVMNVALATDLVDKNPVKRVKFFQEPGGCVRFLSEEEEERLRAEIGQRNWPLIEFAISTGLRQGEQFGLCWSDVDLAHRLVTIPRSHEDFQEPWKHLRHSSHMNYGWAVGGSAMVHPLGGYLAEPVFNQETILYADCEANLIKLAKIVFDSLDRYTRWDVACLAVRKEGWAPEVSLRHTGPLPQEIPRAELRRLSEQFEVPVDKIEGLMAELEKIFDRSRNASDTPL